MDYEGEWSILEQRHDEYSRNSSIPTLERSRRSRVLEMRAQRRKLRKERKLYEIYDRLSALPDATFFVTRDLFLIYGIPEDVREEYVRTHKVVGPGALATYDYAVIFKGHENLTGPTDYTIRASGDVIYPLALVLTYPDTLQGRLSAAEVVQLRRRAAINPNAAAVEAQNYIRRRTKNSKVVVVVGEMNRSVRACCRTIERFSEHMRVYDEPIESLVEGNWIQMFGPNGIHDWSVSAPIVRANALKCLYRMIVTMGTEVVRLLFENEMAIMGVVMVDYGDMVSEPLQAWMPCGASECGVSTDDGFSVLPSPEISDELLVAGEREAIDAMPLCLRSAFERRKSTVLSVKSKRGTHLGNAVDFGGNALVTCTHVAEAAAPGTLNELSLRGISEHIHLLDGGGPWDSICPVREAVVGEFAIFVFVVEDEVRFSSPTVVLRKEDGHIISSTNPVMGKGRSGCALFSLTDMCLLGIFTARMDDLLVSVSIHPALKARVLTVTREISYSRCDGLYEAAMRPSRQAVEEGLIYDGFSMSVCHPGGLVDCTLDSEQRVTNVHLQSRPAANMTFREALEPSEPCRVVLKMDGVYHQSSVHCLNFIDNGCILGFRSGEIVRDSWALLVSELDCAVLGFRLLRSDGPHIQPTERLQIPTGSFNDVFSGQEQSSLSGILGNEIIDEIKEELLTALSGGGWPQRVMRSDQMMDVADYITGLDDQGLITVGSLLDNEFYLELIGDRAINSTFANDHHARLTQIGTTTEKFIYLMFKFLRMRLKPELYDCVWVHIKLLLESDPT